MAELKTHPTDRSPEEYIAALPSEARRADAAAVLALFTATLGGERPVMWGPSMIGWGTVHYRYASGHEGDAMKVGFAPRAAALTFYGLNGNPGSEELLAELGPHTESKACVYVKKLAQIDSDVLARLARIGFDHAEEYYAQAAEAQRAAKAERGR